MANKQPSKACSYRARGSHLAGLELVFVITCRTELFRGRGDAHSSECQASGSKGSCWELLVLEMTAGRAAGPVWLLGTGKP